MCLSCSVFQEPACSLLPWLCMHLFNHRSVLKLPRYPACFGPAVAIGGCGATPRLSAGWVWPRTRGPGVSSWRPVQKSQSSLPISPPLTNTLQFLHCRLHTHTHTHTYTILYMIRPSNKWPPPKKKKFTSVYVVKLFRLVICCHLLYWCWFSCTH